jgi:hypothetical protein
MNRRSLLRLFGLAPLAAVVPAAAGTSCGSIQEAVDAVAANAAQPIMVQPITMSFSFDNKKLAEAVREALHDLN